MKIGRIFILITIVAIIAYFGFSWMIKDAFDMREIPPKAIQINDHKYLFCEQTYSADLASEFYDVKFTLKEKNKNDFYIGRTTFTVEDWDKYVKYNEFDSCIILAVKNYSDVRLIFKEKNNKFDIDTTFLSNDLRKDSLWYSLYEEISNWAYSGNSNLEVINDTTFIIEHKYQTTERDTSKIFKQNIEYIFNTQNGSIKTNKILEREQIY